jgi:hypothetical protein
MDGRKPYPEIPALMAALAPDESVAAQALRLLILKGNRLPPRSGDDLAQDREGCKETTFRMKPAFVSKSGARYRRHTPDPDQLKDAKLKVAEEQPHIPAGGEAGLLDVMGKLLPQLSPLGRAMVHSVTTSAYDARSSGPVGRARLRAQEANKGARVPSLPIPATSPPTTSKSLYHCLPRARC